MNRELLLNQLRNGVVEVTFRKMDGSTRVMKCTLKEEYLPQLENDGMQQAGHDPQNPTPMSPAVPVWDVESNGWRSFRLESVQSVRQLLTE